MVPYENHHHMLKKSIDGVATLITRESHGKKLISRDLAMLMAHQCGLNVSEFWDLVDCPLSQEQWDAKIHSWPGGRNPYMGR
jgi:hypothetical protein